MNPQQLPPACACPACPALIRWVYTSKGGKAPIDAEPHPDGTLVFVLVKHDGHEAWTVEGRRGYRAADLKAQGQELYRFHYCRRH